MEKKKLIFVVDDDAFILELLKRRFSSEEYEIRTFLFGEECLQDLHQNPDLVILDYLFLKPEQQVMNGMEIFNKIKEFKADLPVIMLSGQDRGDIVLELARKGIDDYVIKDDGLIENLKTAMDEILEPEG
ncbi:MAG: response regulator [Bacteroidales bacterium]|nr:MAG: response regulator [Bacteroidales bacterium]